ncbi:M24 family metallopeptidase [Geopsychrobacter electrodiphilus]|uniref:M24 family metallopeptidase n=1 Tax=Geopsychrobacter electrodiphilus TaxID=225196 RepID=UPI000367DCD8|nr:Xaa-Pro peptidase family protein [Geopsychrobacter electrodiphilus]
MRITPKSELDLRTARLQQLMSQQGVDGAVLLQNADLFYFTGSIQQGVCYIPASGEPLYLVRKDFGRARMESGLKQIAPLASLKGVAGALNDHNIPLPHKAGFELDVLPVAIFERWHKALGGGEHCDITPLIRRVKAIKSDYEIAIMKDCGLLMDKIYQRAKEVIQVGKTDLEVSAELEFLARKEGHQGVTRFRSFNSELFYGHMFSGADAAVPAYLDAPLGGLGLNSSIGQGASYKKIAPNEPIIVDFVAAFDGYMVDMTRTFVVGKLPAKLGKAYEDMRRVQQRLAEITRPGVAWGDIYQQCYDFAVELGYKDHFMGNAGAQVSFIGHGIGVEIDEFPFIARGFDDQLLEEKMCFAFEPKAVFVGEGAVGIENTFWVEADGLRRLTYSDEQLVEL